MAKSAARRPAPAKASAAPRGGAMKPVLLAAGLGLYWFVQYQDVGATDAPMWGCVVMVGVRLLADFVGALVVVSALQLLLVLGRLAFAYLRGLWLQVSNG